MRVLIISWEYPPYVVGGMGKHVAQLVPVLSRVEGEKQKIETAQKGEVASPSSAARVDEPLSIDVVTTNYSGGPAVERLDETTTVHRVDSLPIDPLDHYNSVIANNRVLADYARGLGAAHKYSVIHVHDWLTAEAGIALKHEWKVPLIVTIHATERGRHQGWLDGNTSHQIDNLEWRACFEAWRVIVCSKFMADEVHNYFDLPYDKVVVIPNGIDLDALHECRENERSSLRHVYAPNDEFLLFFVGRIVHEKGMQVLIRAMPQILERHPQVRLLLAGKNCEKMWPLAHELGVDNRVTFLGYISNQRRDCIYRTVDAAVFPSLYEPFGIVALEAMALCCNVIASGVGGLKEVVAHGENGLTTLPGDPASIAWAVDYLIGHPQQAVKQRALALTQVRERYNWQRIARRTLGLYEDVVAVRAQTVW